MSWILTSTGKRFDFDNINPDAICIEDIAASLANQCRFNGHTNTFYSVAAHSIIMANVMSQDGYDNKMVKTALLHDASEAYLGDMVKPLKNLVPAFSELENKIMAVIAEKFDIHWPLPDAIKKYDLMMLKAEKECFMPKHPDEWPCFEGVGDLNVDFVLGEYLKLMTFCPRRFEQDFKKLNDIQSACDNLAPVDSN